MNTKYKEIETNLCELTNSLKECFTQSEIDEVIEFIEYNEHGLAFNTTIDIILEENKIISIDSFYLILNLSNAMELDSDDISKKLNHHVR